MMQKRRQRTRTKRVDFSRVGSVVLPKQKRRPFPYDLYISSREQQEGVPISPIGMVSQPFVSTTTRAIGSSEELRRGLNVVVFWCSPKGIYYLSIAKVPMDKPPPANLELWGTFFFFLESTFPSPCCYLLLLSLELIGSSRLAQILQQQQQQQQTIRTAERRI